MVDTITVIPASEIPAETWWQKAKAFFKYSETIFLARLTALSGLVTAGIGYMDWGPLLGLNFDTGFSQKQVFWTGAVVFIKGIIDEITRRRNAPELK